MIARPHLRVVTSRKVRAPQRRVAGNARPPRGEDQCHRDEPRSSLLDRGVKRGKLCSEQGQIGGRGSSVRETGRSDGRGRAAQSSGRPLEPSGNRRPEMDDRRRGFGHGTELGLQAGSPLLLSAPDDRVAVSASASASAARRLLFGKLQLIARKFSLTGRVRCSQRIGEDNSLKLIWPSGQISPRPAGRCGPPCNSHKSPDWCRDRRWGVAFSGPGRGS
jgi:hypothetical protein